MHDPLGRGLIQLLGREVILGAELFQRTSVRLQHLLDLRLDVPFDRAVMVPSFLILPQRFLGTSRMWHQISKCRRRVCLPERNNIFIGGERAKSTSIGFTESGLF